MVRTFNWAGRTFGSGAAFARARSWSVETIESWPRYGDYGDERVRAEATFRINIELEANGAWLEKFLAFMEGQPTPEASAAPALPSAEKALPPAPIEGEFEEGSK